MHSDSLPPGSSSKAGPLLYTTYCLLLSALVSPPLPSPSMSPAPRFGLVETTNPLAMFNAKTNTPGGTATRPDPFARSPSKKDKMQIQKFIAALAGMAVVAEASVTFLDSPLSAALAKRQNRGGNNGQGNKGGNNNNNNNNGGGNNNALCLDANLVQKGSQQAGTPAAGQAQSATDQANFINFCKDEANALTNGEQKTGGSCNSIPMGKIPSINNMVSTIIKNPPPNGNIQANQQFDVQLKVNGLQAGSFTDAQSTYYSAPQNLNQQGQIIGHVHVTIQDMGNSMTPQDALDPKQFVFFKGIDDAGDGKGNLKATVTGGLPAGIYRVCSMSSSSNHQPVLMPVAQRGGQDDCNKFTVGGGGGGGGNNNNGNNNNGNNNGGGNNNGNNGQKQGQGGQGGGRGGGTGSGGQTGNADTSGQAGGAASNSGANNGNSGSGKGGATSNAIGGVQAPAVTNSGDSSRPFSVNGNNFESKTSAAQRACDIQRNNCQDAINRGRVTGSSISDCVTQEQTCIQELS
ncbi:hypothetical protein CSUB01_04966 [Colletotrichum sublineola]|uniref:Ribosomal protein s17 n=1 Tax=Colletotrichum sublineola TaxID=1173701 RepID=A0A066X4H4_COLSU|nr:hypothetical protein CSUB01_04966 [Colletotrichum sublineola]